MKEFPKDMTAPPIGSNRFEKKILLLKLQLKDLDCPGLVISKDCYKMFGENLSYF